MSAAIRKKALRAEAMTARQAAAGSGAESASHAVAELVLAFFDRLPGQKPVVVSGYHAIRDEINVAPVLAGLHGRGVWIALPVCLPGPRLIFRHWVPGAPLQRRGFGLYEPDDENPAVTPGLLLVPLLAFDRKGNRLGYGAGYYDAALRELRARRPAIGAGIAYAEQEMDSIPQEACDERLDYVFTPSGLISCAREV